MDLDFDNSVSDVKYDSNQTTKSAKDFIDTSKKPFFQGSLDGACGIYASINVFHNLKILTASQQETLAKYVFENSAIQDVHDGVTRWKVKRYLEIICQVMNNTDKGHNYRVVLVQPKTLTELFQILDTLNYNSMGAVIGYSGESPHWTVIRGVCKDGYNIFDSSANKPFWKMPKSKMNLQENEQVEFIIEDLFIVARD
jgi:hypothetical protein